MEFYKFDFDWHNYQFIGGKRIKHNQNLTHFPLHKYHLQCHHKNLTLFKFVFNNFKALSILGDFLLNIISFQFLGSLL